MPDINALDRVVADKRRELEAAERARADAIGDFNTMLDELCVAVCDWAEANGIDWDEAPVANVTTLTFDNGVELMMARVEDSKPGSISLVANGMRFTSAPGDDVVPTSAIIGFLAGALGADSGDRGGR